MGLLEYTLSVRPSVTFRVRSKTYIRIDGLPSNLVQMLSSLRRYAYIQEYLGYRSNYFPILDQLWSTILVRFNIPVRLRDKQNVQKKQRRGIKSSFGLPCYQLKGIIYTMFKYGLKCIH